MSREHDQIFGASDEQQDFLIEEGMTQNRPAVGLLEPHIVVQPSIRRRIPRPAPTTATRKLAKLSSRLQPLFWLLGSLILAGVCGYMGLKDAFSTHRRIDQIELGDRTSGRNPLREQVSDEPEPTPDTHRRVDLEFTRPSGSKVQMQFLWSLQQIDQLGSAPGKRVCLEMPEMGVKGDATVLAIGPCPKLKCGEGNLVTGVFRHEPENGLLNIWMEGAEEPTGCTPNHLFWSEDRLDFVPVNDLEIGENVLANHALASQVRRIESRLSSEPVYNLQIHGEHVYEISSAGVLVHNTCPGKHHFVPRSLGSDIPYGDPILRDLNEFRHTKLHRKLSEHLDGITKPGTTYTMLPKKGQSGDVVRRQFSPSERIAALDSFYKTYNGGEYYSDFLTELGLTLARGKFK